ncbi:hypothetical protein M9Y10_045755 [Tritrichomonas musculus]|uniref:Leucine Rich Repeat family protein n=1 Tax=Tritrichomonas musculus TaxID=1915356 RepID=A0ABR2JWK5_9EUKA
MNILVTIDTLDFSIFSQYKDLYDEILDSLLVYPNIQKIIFRLCYPSWSAISKFSEKAQINLSIRDAQMRDPEWHILDEFLQNFMSNTIVSLDYSGNIIQSGFCTFINNSSNLTKLTLNGCFLFSENNIEIFSRYLSSNQNLEELYVIGTDTHYLSSSITFLFKALKTTIFIHVLKISHNMIGNHIFNLILDLITSNLNLMDIYFDFNGISDPQSLRQFIFKMTSLDRKVNIHFPTSDISSMVKNKFIQESEVEKIKENLFRIDDNNSEEKSISNSNFSCERKKFTSIKTSVDSD